MCEITLQSDITISIGCWLHCEKSRIPPDKGVPIRRDVDFKIIIYPSLNGHILSKSHRMQRQQDRQGGKDQRPRRKKPKSSFDTPPPLGTVQQQQQRSHLAEQTRQAMRKVTGFDKKHLPAAQGSSAQFASSGGGGGDGGSAVSTARASASHGQSQRRGRQAQPDLHFPPLFPPQAAAAPRPRAAATGEGGGGGTLSTGLTAMDLLRRTASGWVGISPRVPMPGVPQQQQQKQQQHKRR